MITDVGQLSDILVGPTSSILMSRKTGAVDPKIKLKQVHSLKDMTV